MAFLLLLGNTNQNTFANTIVAANEKSKLIFKKALDKIFVIHSKESEEYLRDHREWVDHLQKNQIDFYEVNAKVIDLASGDKEAIVKFIQHIEFIFNGLGVDQSKSWIVDLTNGTSFQKNLLSITSYILNIPHQFMVNIASLSTYTNERGFLPPDILNKCYEPAPDSTLMDGFAYLDLSEMVRYKKVIESHGGKFARLGEGNVDENFFKRNLFHSIKLKLEGDRKRDNAIYRIATTSISASVEELITEIARMAGGVENRTLGQKIKMIKDVIETSPQENFDFEFFKKFNDLMLYIRNSATHKGKLLNDTERFKAELALKMSFPFLEFYSDIVFNAVKGQSENPTHRAEKIQKVLPQYIDGSISYYFGLDGDDTGSRLEGMFVDKHYSEKEFKAVSAGILKAIQSISKQIKSSGGEVVFEAGDDLLFKGTFSYNQLVEMQKTYEREANGQTCSIGFGNSLYATFMAMNIAKAHPGKNTIVGIRVFDEENKS